VSHLVRTSLAAALCLSATCARAQGSLTHIPCTAPAAIAVAAPQYPEFAWRARFSAVVPVNVTIDTAGRVSEASVDKDLPFGLSVVAREAALQWRFQPQSPASCSKVVLTFEFSLVPRGDRSSLQPPVVVQLPSTIKVVAMEPALTEMHSSR
jgi:TonB family protein